MGDIVGSDHRVGCLDPDGDDRSNQQWLALATAT